MAVDVEAAVVRMLCGFVGMLLVLVLGLPPLTADSLRLEMEETQTALLNANVTIFCKVSGSPHLNISLMGIIWCWKNPKDGTYDNVFEFYGNHQKAFRSGANVSLEMLAKGDASLHLPGVQLREAGEYQCKVVNTPDKGQRTVFLDVVGRPEVEAKVKDDDAQYLLCNASGFYPKGINITWYMWNQTSCQYLKISENITDSVIENEDKTFNATSSLKLKHSSEHNVTYQCMVEHISLPTSWRGNITLSFEKRSNPESGSCNLVCIIAPCLVVPLIAVIFL